MAHRLTRVVTSPWLYSCWALVAVAVMWSTYFIDPYVFGFATLGAMWVTAVMTPVGLGASLLAGSRSRGARWGMALAALVPAIAVFVALRVLRGFKWA
jgi:hypothetical protein